MIISDLLTEKENSVVQVVRPGRTLADAARDLVSRNIGVLVVTDEGGNIVGIISERDLTRAIAEHDGSLVDISVGDVMTRSVVTAEPESSVAEILKLMKSNRIRHVPVLEGGELVGIVSIRELDRAYELLQTQANEGSLTGLSNRRHFLQLLNSEFDRSRRHRHPLSVAMIDVDHFKRFNDTYGHDVGDKVLCVLADLLVQELRTIDVVGRLGGEEFAAIFPETELGSAKIACDRLLEKIRTAEIDIDDVKTSFTVSIGLTVANPATQEPAGVLKRADELLYDAKSAGRDRVRVDTPHRVLAMPGVGDLVRI